MALNITTLPGAWPLIEASLPGARNLGPLIKAPGAEKWGAPQDTEKAKKSTFLCIGFCQFLPSASTRGLGPRAPLILAERTARIGGGARGGGRGTPSPLHVDALPGALNLGPLFWGRRLNAVTRGSSDVTWGIYMWGP